MPYKLTVDMPSLGDQEVYIHGLGSFGNGTHDITDEQAEMYEVLNTVNLVNVGSKDLADDTDEETAEAEHLVQRGQSLVDAVKGMYGVEIEEDTGESTPTPRQVRTPPRPVDSGTGNTETAQTGTSESGGES